VFLIGISMTDINVVNEILTHVSE